MARYRIALLSALFCGCGGSAPSATGQDPICDGSSDIRFAFKVDGGGGGGGALTELLSELGFEFLFIDGKCRYWVSQPSATDDYRPWRPYRSGTLTDAQEKAIRAATRYHDSTVQLECVVNEARDSSSAFLWDGIGIRICHGSIKGPIDWPSRTELYDHGAEVTGPMRVVVGKQSVPSDAFAYPWLLANPPETYLIDDAGQRGRSALIDNPSDAAALRAVRAKMLDDVVAAPGFFYGVVPIENTGMVMVMRDHLPFSRPADGLWEPQ